MSDDLMTWRARVVVSRLMVRLAIDNVVPRTSCDDARVCSKREPETLLTISDQNDLNPRVNVVLDRL
jgi:hypothetical protein